MAGFLMYLLSSMRPSGKQETIATYVSRSTVATNNACSKLPEAYSRSISRITTGGVQRFIPQCAKECRKRGLSKERSSRIGTVTFINEEHGMIDDFIYFDASSVGSFADGDRQPKVGDQVNVDLERLSDCGWRALSVFVVDESREFESLYNSVPQDSHSLCCICHIDDRGITVNQGLTFSFDKVQEGYKPAVGDWIRLDLTATGEVTSLRPLRVKELTGKVTSSPRINSDGVETAEGRVNDDVSISVRSCEDGYIPKRGDLVSAHVMEVKQNYCTWRALSTKFLSRGFRNSNQKSQTFESGNWVLRGGFPEKAFTRRSTPSFLPKYTVPEKVRLKVEEGDDILAILPSLSEKLSMENYAQRFSALLYLEEIHNELEMRKYRISGARLERKGQYLSLNVPGIADGKPDLSVSDLIVLHTKNRADTEYHGFIHHILPESEEILLKFHAEFQENFDSLENYDVEFKHGRVPFRRCHFAARLAQRRGWRSLLFPDGGKYQNADVNSSPVSNIEDTTEFFNSKLNSRQKQAVCRIMAKHESSSPYIIFGPPGTGKTMTLVEVIMQLYFSSHSSRILVCAPSNSAVDVICERIARYDKIQSGDMARFNAIRRLENSIPLSIVRYCRSEEEIEVTSRYRIILTTCTNAGAFFGLKLPGDHFTHVCIDEAGQATEPEILIPIGLQINARLIFAGDPQQLGPVIMSPFASAYGLSVSLLERLMAMDTYQHSEQYPDGYDPTLITKLVNNYRSHCKLIEIPSSLFYMNELVACKEKADYSNLREWDCLPRKGFPLIFHGVGGQHVRERDSPSLMNPAEIVQIVRYVKMLVRDQMIDVSDIGVVTPYRKQVEKIRMLLKGVNTEGVKVGSVEEFQGQEKSVIVVSTVRSNGENSGAENTSSRLSLGFLSNFRRFNVAVTRARDLLIIVGNPNLLMLDHNWNALLQFACEHGGYTGCELK